MARLASQAKMGYYPTPERVSALIKNMIQIESDPSEYAVLDPCCGTGEFVRAMPEGVRTYGNDLDKERYQKAKETVDHVLYGDANFDIKATNKAFSCLYLNPPYDWTTDIEDRSVRMEYLFLKHTTKYLKQKGLLIFIIPRETLASCAQLLSFHYKGIKVYPFPEEEYRDFRQVVVFAYRSAGSDDKTKELLDELGRWDDWRGPLPLKRLDEIVLDEPFTMKPAGEIKTFKSLKVNVDDLKRVVDGKGSSIEDLYVIEDTVSIKTPMPLRKGHMAMLLASGYMNGEFRNLTEWFLVKGSTKKKLKIEESKGKRIETDKIEIVLKALDMNNGEFIDIK